MKVLNLYAGIGGNRKLWEDVEVTAVELDPAIAKIYQDYFPDDKVIVGDAHQYLLDHYKEFDFIWASPPCPTHSRIRKQLAQKKWGIQNLPVYPDMTLYQEIIFLDGYFNGKYCVENVEPFYTPLIPAKKLGRHLFWTNFKVGLFELNHKRNHEQIRSNDNLYGFQITNSKIKDKIKTLRNMVDPDVSAYILNCARNIITKSNVHQTHLFE